MTVDCRLMTNNKLKYLSMKLKLMLLFLGGFLMMSSCKKDKESCPADDLSGAIVGVWNVSALGQAAGQVEFKADGTLIDPDDILISGESNGTVLDDKSYTVPSNQQLKVKAAKDAQFLEATLAVTSFDCDVVELTAFGITATLTRK